MPMLSRPACVMQSHTAMHSNDCVCCISVFFPPPVTVLHPIESLPPFHVRPTQFKVLFICGALVYNGILRVQVVLNPSRTIAPSCTIMHSSSMHRCLAPHSPFLWPRPRHTWVFQSHTGPGLRICSPNISMHCVSSSAVSLRYCRVRYIVTCTSGQPVQETMIAVGFLSSMFGTICAIGAAIKLSVASTFGCCVLLTPIAMFVGLRITG